MSEIICLHNPRCSKSREAVAILSASGQPFLIREYLAHPLNRHEVEDLHKKTAAPIASLIRSKEPLFAELGLNHRQPSDDEWYQVLADHPKLLERPIVIMGEKAIVARPPELLHNFLRENA